MVASRGTHIVDHVVGVHHGDVKLLQCMSHSQESPSASLNYPVNRGSSGFVYGLVYISALSHNTRTRARVLCMLTLTHTHIPAGVAALGRGLATIPYHALEEAGLPSTLSTLAEDAVGVSE